MTSNGGSGTIVLREPSSPIGFTVETEPPILPPWETLREGLLSETNRATDAPIETWTYHQEKSMSPDEGSGSVAMNLPSFVFRAPRLGSAKEHFNAFQKWVGVILSVDRDVFTARLTPVVGEGSDQEAEIYLNEVVEEDHNLIQPGAVFYWSIGYLDRPSGRLRASVIRFQRLPAFTDEDIEAARAKASELQGFLHDQ